MAWNNMPTWVAGQVIIVGFLNSIKDNFNETAPAKATGIPAGHFVPTGVNTIAQREIKELEVIGSNTTTSTTYVSLGSGPAVAVVTGQWAVVSITAQISNASANNYGAASVTYAGVAATDAFAFVASSASADAPYQGTATNIVGGLTAGSNTFTMQFRVGGGTGTFQRRRLLVMAL